MLLCEPHSFYGPFRGGPAGLAAQLSPARPIIHIRDPRDCLVSLYYSLRYSHPLPGGAAADDFLQLRRSVETMTIDDFVCGFLLDELLCDRRIGSGLVRHLQLFRALIERRPDAILSKYEDMVTEFPDWLVAIVEQFGIPIDYEMIIDLIARTDFLVNLRVEEDRRNHKRQITPGDHRRKLTAETQAILADFYAEDLEYFGYR